MFLQPNILCNDIEKANLNLDEIFEKNNIENNCKENKLGINPNNKSNESYINFDIEEGSSDEKNIKKNHKRIKKCKFEKKQVNQTILKD